MSDIRKVSFIDPNDGEVTYGLLNADNTAGIITTSESAQQRALTRVIAGLDELDSVADIAEDWGAADYLAAIKAMIEANPVA